MSLGLSILALILALFVYGLIARKQARSINSTKDLFHFAHTNSGIVTLTAASLTLGTGFIYLIDLSKSQALFAALTPIGILLGYFALARIVSAANFTANDRLPNVIHILKDPESKRNAVFHTVSLLQIATYIFIIGFEIYLSSLVLSEIMFPNFGATAPISVALFVLLISTAYTAMGGFRGVVATDWVQASIILVLIFLFYAILFDPTFFDVDLSPSRLSSLIHIPWGQLNWLVIIAAVVVAVATQIYSAVNTAVGSNFSATEQSAIFRRVGITLAVVYLLVIGLGLAWPSQPNAYSFAELFGRIAQAGNIWGQLAAFVMVFGLLALLLSSIDSVLVAVAQLIRDNYFNGKKGIAGRISKSVVVWRVVIVAIGFAAILPISILFKYQPNLVKVLLAGLTGLTMSAPIIAAAVLSRKYTSGRLWLLHNGLTSLLLPILVFSAIAFAFYDAVVKSGELSQITTLVSVSVTSIIGIGIYRNSRTIGG